MAAEPTEANATRRAMILDAAMTVFLRYGFKKTSMDELARAAGLSRQGLYLHYPTKEDLFRAAVLALGESIQRAGRAALALEHLSVEERILGAFEATSAPFIGQIGAGYMDELLETATALVGPLIGELERELVDEIARLLRRSGVAAAWKAEGISAKELGEHLVATSNGVKHAVTTAAAYHDRMRVAVRIVCGRR